VSVAVPLLKNQSKRPVIHIGGVMLWSHGPAANVAVRWMQHPEVVAMLDSGEIVLAMQAPSRLESQPASPSAAKPAQAAPTGPTSHPRRDYTESDAKLVEEMHQRLTRKRKPANDAARLVVKAAQGKGTEENKVKRLVALYYRIHPRKR
jgi:hypothetical protein